MCRATEVVPGNQLDHVGEIFVRAADAAFVRRQLGFYQPREGQNLQTFQVGDGVVVPGIRQTYF